MAKEIEQALKDLRNASVAWTARRDAAALAFCRHHKTRSTCERYLTGFTGVMSTKTRQDINLSEPVFRKGSRLSSKICRICPICPIKGGVPHA